MQLNAENVLQSPTTQPVGVAVAGGDTHKMTSLPVSFGRLPLSTAEMESINVNIKIILTTTGIIFNVSLS